jgi:hypothetical protein
MKGYSGVNSGSQRRPTFRIPPRPFFLLGPDIERIFPCRFTCRILDLEPTPLIRIMDARRPDPVAWTIIKALQAQQFRDHAA